MFWTRLGKELPAGFLKETLGESGFSGEMTGSTYELLTALEAARSGKPKVFVFRKTEEPTYKLTDAKEHNARSRIGTRSRTSSRPISRIPTAD